MTGRCHTHPARDSWAGVPVYESDGRYKAGTHLPEDSRGTWIGDTPQEAARAALTTLGEPYASEMAEAIDLRVGGNRGS